MYLEYLIKKNHKNWFKEDRDMFVIFCSD